MQDSMNMELNKYRMENEMMNKEIMRLNQEGVNEDDEKLMQLQYKKQEVLAELERLHKKHQELDDAVNRQQEFSRELDKKKEEIRALAEKYKTDDFIEVLDSDACATVDEGTISYIYDLNRIYDEVISVGINDFSIPHALYNITRSNNKLYINENVIEIEEGNYDIDTLITALAETAPDIKVTVSKVNNKETLTSDAEFTLENKDDSILAVLGIVNNDAKPKKKLTGSKPYNLQKETVVNVHVNGEHISTMSLGTHKICNTNAYINLDDKLEVRLYDSKNKLINHYVNHRLELQIKTKNTDFI